MYTVYPLLLNKKYICGDNIYINNKYEYNQYFNFNFLTKFKIIIL